MEEGELMANVIAEVLMTAKEKLDEALLKAKSSITEINDLLNKINDSDIITEVHTARGDKASLTERLTDIINLITNYKNDVCTFVMPLPTTAEENTKKLQDYIDFGKNYGKKVKIVFRDGVYDLNTCIIYKNTTLELQKDTIINHVRVNYYNPNLGREAAMNPLFLNAKPYDSVDSANITGYNGNGNIKINNGTIKAYNPFAFIHGENIEFNNIVFEETKSEHAFQIGSCKNVVFNNCEFKGIKETTTDRNYVEMVQLDWATYDAMPYWLEGSAIYDNNVNDNIVFNRCKFSKGEGEYNHVYTCIGSHGTTTVKNKNIHINDCEFSDFEYTGVRPYYMDGVYINNCKFNTDSSMPLIYCDNSNNIYINNCSTKGGNRAFFIVNSNNVNIDSINANSLSGADSFGLLGECSNVTINNISFSNSTSTSYGMLVRNCKDVIIDKVKDINNTITSSKFFRITNKDDGISDRITVNNIATSCDTIVYASNTTNIIDDMTNEVIFSGDAGTGDITLLDDINNFKDLKILFNFYGNREIDLSFYNNITYIKDFNIADDISTNTNFNFLEGKITKKDNKTLTIDLLNQINIINNVTTAVTTTAGIIKITGKRIKYGASA